MKSVFAVILTVLASGSVFANELKTSSAYQTPALGQSAGRVVCRGYDIQGQQFVGVGASREDAMQSLMNDCDSYSGRSSMCEAMWGITCNQEVPIQ
jgi:hypothetical protein